MIAKATAKTWPKLRYDPISISWCFPGGSIIGLENSIGPHTPEPSTTGSTDGSATPPIGARSTKRSQGEDLINALAARGFQSTAGSESVRRNSAINTAGLRVPD